MNEQQEYIRAELREGKSHDAIIEALTQNGWSKEQAARELARVVEGGTSAAPVITPVKFWDRFRASWRDFTAHWGLLTVLSILPYGIAFLASAAAAASILAGTIFSQSLFLGVIVVGLLFAAAAAIFGGMIIIAGDRAIRNESTTFAGAYEATPVRSILVLLAMQILFAGILGIAAFPLLFGDTGANAFAVMVLSIPALLLFAAVGILFFAAEYILVLERTSPMTALSESLIRMRGNIGYVFGQTLAFFGVFWVVQAISNIIDGLIAGGAVSATGAGASTPLGSLLAAVVSVVSTVMTVLFTIRLLRERNVLGAAPSSPDMIASKRVIVQGLLLAGLVGVGIVLVVVLGHLSEIREFFLMARSTL